LSVIRHTRVVARKLDDGAIRTYDIYRTLQDRSLITRHGSPLFMTEPLIADRQIYPRHGSPGFLEIYDPRSLMADSFLLARHGSPGFMQTYDPRSLMADSFLLTRHGSPECVTATLLGPRSVTDVKQDWLTQVGSAASGAYWVYPVAYVAAPIGAGLAPAVSHGAYSIYMSRLVAGSCVPVGSPGAYLYVSVSAKVT